MGGISLRQAFILSFLLSWIFALEVQGQDRVLRTALTGDIKATRFDSLDVSDANQSLLLRTLYLGLIYFDTDSEEYVSGIARKFYWRNGRLHFEIRRDIITKDGWRISAQDVVFSLKRLFLKGRMVPGNLGDLLCPGLKSIDEDCQKISTDGETVMLAFPSQKPSYLEIFADKRFSIIPRKAVDPKSLRIVDYQNTSGPYRMAGPDDKKLVLVANAGHYLLHPDSPREIQFFQNENTIEPKAVRMFLDDQLDYIGPREFLSQKHLDLMQGQVKDLQAFKSSEIAMVNLHFTDSAMTLPVATRQDISRLIQRAIRESKELFPKYRKAKRQLYSEGAFASLNRQQLEQVDAFLAKKPSKLPFKVRLGIDAKAVPYYKNILKPILDSIEFVTERPLPPISGEPSADAVKVHLILTGTDISFFESFNQVAWEIEKGFFHLRGASGRAWIEGYLLEPAKAKREEKLRQLHFESLVENPALIPLFSKNYIAVARNGWKIKSFSQNYSTVHFWNLGR